MNTRQYYRQQRRSILTDVRQGAEASIWAELSALCTPTACIAAYAAFDGEPDLTTWLSQTRATVALPRIGNEPGQMTFHRWHHADAGQHNRLGIFEPALAAEEMEPDQFDIMLIPLVAFDNRGTRLGMGAGYYDRYLPRAEKAQRIGIGFTCQFSQSPLERENWDQPLDLVITESGIMRFSR